MKLRSGKIKSLFNYDLIKHEDYIYLSVMDIRTKSLTPKFKEELYTEIRETFGYNLRVSMTEYFPEPETIISILNERNFHKLYEWLNFIGKCKGKLENYTGTWQLDIKIERYVARSFRRPLVGLRRHSLNPRRERDLSTEEDEETAADREEWTLSKNCKS